MKISVISPVYGAASLLKELVKEIETAVLNFPLLTRRGSCGLFLHGSFAEGSQRWSLGR